MSINVGIYDQRIDLSRILIATFFNLLRTLLYIKICPIVPLKLFECFIEKI